MKKLLIFLVVFVGLAILGLSLIKVPAPKTLVEKPLHLKTA